MGWDSDDLLMVVAAEENFLNGGSQDSCRHAVCLGIDPLISSRDTHQRYAGEEAQRVGTRPPTDITGPEPRPCGAGSGHWPGGTKWRRQSP